MDFFYDFPGLCQLKFLSRDFTGPLWSTLCSYVHGDLKVLTPLNVVADIHSFLHDSDGEFDKLIRLVQQAIRLLVAVLFAVESEWLKSAEKAYFDAVIEIYTLAERTELLENLKIT